MELPDLSAVDFTVVRKRGYSQQEVDRFLQVLDDELRRIEAETRLLERRLEELESRGESPAGEAPSPSFSDAPPDAVVQAKERLLARARATAVGILEDAYRHAGIVDPETLPDDLDGQVRDQVAAMLVDPNVTSSPAVGGATREPEERLAAAELISEQLVLSAQREAERIVTAARAEHLGLVARIARLQDLEAQLAMADATASRPRSGRGVIVDLTGDEPVVTVAEEAVQAEPMSAGSPEDALTSTVESEFAPVRRDPA